MKFKKSISTFLATVVLGTLFSSSAFAVWTKPLANPGMEAIDMQATQRRMLARRPQNIAQALAALYFGRIQGQILNRFLERFNQFDAHDIRSICDLFGLLKQEIHGQNNFQTIAPNNIQLLRNAQNFIRRGLHRNLWIVSTYRNGRGYSRRPVNEGDQPILLLLYGYDVGRMKVRVFDPEADGNRKITERNLTYILDNAQSLVGIQR